MLDVFDKIPLLGGSSDYIRSDHNIIDRTEVALKSLGILSERGQQAHILIFPYVLLLAPAWLLRRVKEVVAFGLFAVYAALRAVLLMRTGTLFDDRVGLRMRQVGIGTSGSGLADFCANLVSPSILSLTNPTGQNP